MKLFSKLNKDYNNLLEEILDRKTFSSVAKSLLLSMIYKLEVSYKDYEKIKINSVSKDEFLTNVLNVVNDYCDNIKTVEPESIQAKLLVDNNVDAVTNSKERSILVYPTEIAMLYAISDIEPKFFFVKKDFLFKDTLQKLLVDGYKQSTVEILKNFNGWSWDINAKQNANYIYNLVYQNLIMIAEEEFVYNWRTDKTAHKDYLSSLKKIIKSITGNDNYYWALCELLYIISNQKEKNRTKKQLEAKCQEYEKMNVTEKKKIDELKKYNQIINTTKSAYDALIILQKFFLEIMQKKIKRLEFREEIIDIIYQLRYYQNIVIFEGVLVKEYSGLKDMLDLTLKLAITKACKMGVIKIISMDIDTNFEIIQYILDTRIIDLEEIKIYLELEDENIYIKVYDKEVFEKQGKNKFNGNKKDIVIKKKRLIKLFN